MDEEKYIRGSILDPTKEPLPEKRKFVYCMHPNDYEVDGCVKCGGHNVTYSEYAHHNWCFDCKIDFVPKHFGIFDGPIPVQLCNEMGIKFDRINIETGERIVHDADNLSEEWKNSWP